MSIQTVKAWQIRLFGMCLDQDDLLISLRDDFPLTPPRDPEEGVRQARMRIDLGIHISLSRLFRIEFMTLENREAIGNQYHDEALLRESSERLATDSSAEFT